MCCNEISKFVIVVYSVQTFSNHNVDEFLAHHAIESYRCTWVNAISIHVSRVM